MERLAQRFQHLTKSILKAVGKLLSLLSVMPWDVMVEFLQQLRAGRVDRSRWPEASQQAMLGTTWFDKWLYQAIYWYLIEQIAERLKSGELRNASIYEFTPDAVYDAKRVEQFDLDATRILPEIQAMGYTGGVHTVRRYIHQLKQRTKLLSQATVRFETPPAKQAQCDWGHVGKFPDPSGKLIDIYVFVIVLSYSRRIFIRFTTRMKLPALKHQVSTFPRVRNRCE
jgi:hypothetical protein